MFLETQRLILRNVRPEDAEDIYPIRHSDFVMRYNAMTPRTLEQVRAGLEKDMKTDGHLHIVLKETGRVIGMIGTQEDQLRYEVDAVTIDYYIAELYARQGYMTEALSALMGRLFKDQSLELISARVFAENIASQALLERLGFTCEGMLRKGLRTPDGTPRNDKLYSILREEFESRAN